MDPAKCRMKAMVLQAS